MRMSVGEEEKIAPPVVAGMVKVMVEVNAAVVVRYCILSSVYVSAVSKTC